MANSRKLKRKLVSLDERFTFIGDGVGPSDETAFKSFLFEVEDKNSGAARILKLWRKTGTSIPTRYSGDVTARSQSGLV